MSLAEIITNISSTSVLIPIVIYLWKIKSTPSNVHPIGVLVLVSATFDLIGYYFYTRKISVGYLFNFQDVFQYVVLAWFYFDILFKGNKRLEQTFGLVHYSVSFILFSITRKLLSYQEGIWILSSILLVAYAVAFLVKLRRTTSDDYRWKIGVSWINLGVLMYFSTAVWFYVFMDDLLKLPPEDFKSIWSVHNSLNIIKNGLYAYGLFLSKRTIQIR